MKNDEKNNSKKEITISKSINRLNKKTDELKKRFKVPPEFEEEEPSGLLSGGPEHLDIPDDIKNKK